MFLSDHHGRSIGGGMEGSKCQSPCRIGDLAAAAGDFSGVLVTATGSGQTSPV